MSPPPNPLPPPRRACRILELQPVGRTPRSVTQPLRDNSLQPHLAGVPEDDIPLRVLQVLVQAHAMAALAQDAAAPVSTPTRADANRNLTAFASPQRFGRLLSADGFRTGGASSRRRASIIHSRAILSSISRSVGSSVRLAARTRSFAKYS